MKRFFSITLCLLTLCAALCSCAKNGESGETWGPQALDYFNITAADVSGSDKMVQTLDATAMRSGPLALNVTQTVGDGKTLYVLFTVTLPDDWRDSFLSEGEDPSVSVTADVVLFPYDSDEELNAPPERITAWRSTGSTYHYSAAENLLEGGLLVYDRDMELNGRDLCLALRSVTMQKNDTVLAQIEDDLSVMWTAQNDAAWRSFEDDDLICRISPLCIDINGFVDGQIEENDLIDTVKLLDADGAVLQDLRMTMSGSASKDPNGGANADMYACPLGALFHDFSKIAAVSVGGITYPVA